jgi:hypothetical protein
MLVKNIRGPIAECPSGTGVRVSVGQDANSNGILDEDEVANSYYLCDGSDGKDGAAGQNGISTGILVTAASTCSAGGIDIQTFLDPSNTGVYQIGDTITSLSTICNGVSGENGVNGNSVQVTQTSATAEQCPTGGIVYTVVKISGITGQVIEESQESAVICNGAVGPQGEQGPVSPFSPVTPVQPCGAASSPYKEVLLCLKNGSVLSSFSDTMGGDNTRLAFLQPGTFMDTDASGCVFTVSANSEGDTVISWNAGSNQYSSWDSASFTCEAN